MAPVKNTFICTFNNFLATLTQLDILAGNQAKNGDDIENTVDSCYTVLRRLPNNKLSDKSCFLNYNDLILL